MAQMPPGFSWNGGQFPSLADSMNMNPLMFNNMMPNNQPMMSSNQLMMPNNNTSNHNIINHSEVKESRSRRRTRSRDRSRDRSPRDRSGDRDRRGDSKRSHRNDGSGHSKTSDGNNVNTLNPMMMNNMMSQPGAMMPMGGGMFPGNMMMGSFPNMMPSAGMDVMPAGGLEVMGQAQMDMMNSGVTGDMNMMGGIIMDPSMMGMGMFPPIGGDMSAMDRKELVLKNCTLTPPALGTPAPPQRDRPAGCRTIFIGGLPDKVREEHIKEIFERFGRIYTLRLSKKNFCHIRYDRESSVDSAMAISGYRLRLTDVGESDEENHNNAGWLHVDFALSRDDQLEFERRQKREVRDALRQDSRQESRHESRHESRSEPRRERSREHTSSPATWILPYSGIVVSQISEKIRSEENFLSAVPTLLAWLERGECSKKNANSFYSMIQAVNGHSRRLYNEKIQVEDEWQQSKETFKLNFQKIITQFEQVAKILAAAAHQRVWDHFTKPQRKNIETWQKMSQDFQTIKDEFYDRFADEDDFGDNDNKMNDYNELRKVKTENENLQFQLEAYKNEVDVIKADASREYEKFKAQFIARQALNNVMDNKLPQPPPPPPKPNETQKPPPPPPLPEEADSDEVKVKSEVEPGCGEAKLIGVMSAFLQVHPHGASLDYVVSYVRALFPSINQATVHHVLLKHTDVFQKKTTGVGAGIEHRWSFVALQDV